MFLLTSARMQWKRCCLLGLVDPRKSALIRHRKKVALHVLYDKREDSLNRHLACTLAIFMVPFNALYKNLFYIKKLHRLTWSEMFVLGSFKNYSLILKANNMSMERFQNLLKELGVNVGLADLKPNNDGLCSLRFDDRVTIDLEYHEESTSLIFSSIIGTLLAHQTEKIYPDLLEANLLWAGTGGATLGVDPVTLSAFLCYKERIEEMDFVRFQDLLKGFSDVAIFWNKRLQEEPSPDSSDNTLPSRASQEETAPASAIMG